MKNGVKFVIEVVKSIYLQRLVYFTFQNPFLLRRLASKLQVPFLAIALWSLIYGKVVGIVSGAMFNR